MKKQAAFVVSASMLVIASQAMASTATDSVISVETFPEPAGVSEILARNAVKGAIAPSFSEIATRFGVDGVSLADRVLVAQADDFETNGGGSVSNPSVSESRSSSCHSSGGW